MAELTPEERELRRRAGLGNPGGGDRAKKLAEIMKNRWSGGLAEFWTSYNATIRPRRSQDDLNKRRDAVKKRAGALRRDYDERHLSEKGIRHGSGNDVDASKRGALKSLDELWADERERQQKEAREALANMKAATGATPLAGKDAGKDPGKNFAATPDNGPENPPRVIVRGSSARSPDGRVHAWRPGTEAVTDSQKTAQRIYLQEVARAEQRHAKYEEIMARKKWEREHSGELRLQRALLEQEQLVKNAEAAAVEAANVAARGPQRRQVETGIFFGKDGSVQYAIEPKRADGKTPEIDKFEKRIQEEQREKTYRENPGQPSRGARKTSDPDAPGGYTLSYW